MASAGIALSEAEASVASPFTSRRNSIDCVLSLIAEGRAGLTNAHATFRFMALYSLTQFASVLLLYSIGSNMIDSQFLYIDLVLATLIGMSIGQTPASRRLSPARPSISLAAPFPMLAFLAHLLILTAAQVAVFAYVRSQPWCAV